eukprot:TRINITY_DN574_c1_g1_i2.p2 TRINITY_DN574_c1_g1~~TRINITY_DN574_c1_g1_i2.p2  ORF type:complete len:106 (-),score=5.37 TRINITY_DN574_c1_g1_i2:185-502(-)
MNFKLSSTQKVNNSYCNHKAALSFRNQLFCLRSKLKNTNFIIQAEGENQQQRGKEYYEGLLKSDIQERNNASGLEMLIPNLKFILTAGVIIGAFFLIFMFSNGLI